MSRKSEAFRSIQSANNRLGGARVSQVQRGQKCRRFIRWCFDAKHPVTSLAEVQAEWVRHYLAQRRDGCVMSADGVANRVRPLSLASLHNELAAIRRGMSALGVDPDARGISADAMGLGQRARRGTKRPITDEEFERAIARAMDMGEVGFAIALRLERFLGLRCQEAMMSTRRLLDWAHECESTINRGMPSALHIEYGTKGGRPRVSIILRQYAKETVAAIHEALTYTMEHGHLIHPKRAGERVGSLKFARAKYHRLAQRVGLVGEVAPHSLRYRYAVDLLRQLIDDGVPQREALSLVAENLGHGGGRRDMVARVYGASVAADLPRSTRRQDLRGALALVEHLASLD